MSVGLAHYYLSPYTYNVYNRSAIRVARVPTSLPFECLCHSVNGSTQVFSAVFGTSFSVFHLANCSIISSESESKRNFDSVRKETGLRLDSVGKVTSWWGELYRVKFKGWIAWLKSNVLVQCSGRWGFESRTTCSNPDARKQTSAHRHYGRLIIPRSGESLCLSVTGELAVLWPCALNTMAVRSPTRRLRKHLLIRFVRWCVMVTVPPFAERNFAAVRSFQP